MDVLTALVFGYFTAVLVVCGMVLITGTNPWREVRDIFCLWRDRNDSQSHLFSWHYRLYLKLTLPWDVLVIWNDKRRERAQSYRAKVREDKKAHAEWMWLDAFWDEHCEYVKNRNPLSLKVTASLQGFVDAMKEMAAAKVTQFSLPKDIKPHEHGPRVVWGENPKPLPPLVPFNYPVPAATDYRQKFVTGLQPRTTRIGTPIYDATMDVFHDASLNSLRDRLDSLD